jgi:glycosyltransferase involved in cell wall biosynthesis
VSEPRKVLILVDTLYLGGAERVAVGLATHLPRDRYEVTVCATRRHSGPLTDELRAAGVRYESLDRRGRFDLAPFRHLVRLLRRERHHVLHSHGFGSNLWGSIFGRLAGTPVVVAHEHSWSFEGQRLRRLLDRHVIARLADVIVAVSNLDRERMTSVVGIPPRKTTYLPNAFIPSAMPEQQRVDLRASLGLPAGTPLVGTVAVLRYEKALDVLIDAFAIALKRVPEAHLVVGGFGPALDGWRAHAESLGVGERVHWLGKIENPSDAVAQFDVAAMSSDREGMPIFSFECMTVRTPLVATDVGGLRDVFEHERSALLVPRRDPPAMAAALERLLLDRDYAETLAGAAHARLDDFSIDRALERVTGLYESLLAKSRRAAGRSD